MVLEVRVRNPLIETVVGPSQSAIYRRLRPGACDKALAAAAFSVFVDLGFESTLAAAEAALEPV